ncbi:TetR/AcrR family transcriptional regulator [Franconibacter helveticus 513]|uniref:TetR/AcrR family transcriptional regulator n=1 Tax=Franconibacter helveticus TaxID=357240 RepID=UPI0003FF5FFE|nr:TetR/AcrR family transcriptional regulator [Franconibacter helveticus]
MTTEAAGCTKKSRGRPKVFDREAALDKAMTLFWQHGYEATSLAHLVEATGAKAPTLYAEFTNKEGLFRAVLDRYITRFAEKQEALLFDDSKSVEQALESYCSEVAACFTSTDTPAGCFIITTSAALAASSDEIASAIKARHTQREQILSRFFAQRQARGELPASCNIDSLVRFVSCMLHGMSVSAREGAKCSELKEVIHTLLRLWPQLVNA